ncbi:MAG: ABC transporter permease subunit [Austwickia sp.]|nr:ABC transporter permease subunit [Austwickia sp.]MBK8436355.1 ABC transporter permease subunit [Austwickia sp.]MBK9102031.1 ABC transporter permease subunit [Austwickia sp.]
MAAKGWTFGVIVVALLGTAVLLIYGTQRAVPMKYLLPGMLVMAGLQIWPMVFTAGIAFTNYGDGHLFSKETAIQYITANSVREVPGSTRYTMSIAVPDGQPKETGDLVFLLTQPQAAAGDPPGAPEVTVGTTEGLRPLGGNPADVALTATGKVTKAPGYQVLSGREANRRSKDLASFAVPTGPDRGIKASGLSEAYEGAATVTYDPATDLLTDKETNRTYRAGNGRFVATDGSGDSFPQGWLEGVGLNNFTRVLTEDSLRTGFVGAFIWNIAFAGLTVIGTFVLGMLIALLFNDPRLRGRGLYRSLLILPYALPTFVTALVWRGMFNQDYGLINNLTGLNVDWLGSSGGARAALLITNLWLGFPYMFLVCTGALQSIPSDVKEAARIDGASGVQTLVRITMPLLLVAVGPLLIATFAFNFNNFSVVYLLTKGGPFEGGQTDIGATDLLITMAYRLAFSGSAPNYGFAAAVCVFIFAVTALMILPSFRATRALEEVN